MHFKLAILTALARRPDGRATLEEISREVEVLTANEDQAQGSEELSPVGDIDIFQSGLVVPEGHGLQITDAGRSLLDAWEALTEPSLSSVSSSTSTSLKPIDDLIGNEGQTNAPKVSRREKLFKAIAARIERASRIWRGHLVRDVPNTTASRRTAGIGGGTFALLTLLVVTICAGALVALTQIKTLKTEIASLKRELLPLRERLTKYDQAERAMEVEVKAAAEKSKASTQNRSEQAPLTFSREEVQLIRDYIKPAPFAGIASPAINVGDPIGAMIPLPSPLMEKVPKLIGARFTTRNGAIIISVKNSRRADAVLAPN
jgi:hypothetical protein